MTHPNDPARDPLDEHDDDREQSAEPGPEHDHQPPHPPFARSPDEYTDPPGHHRRGPQGPALDVGG